MIFYNLLQRLMLIATARLNNYAETSNTSITATPPPPSFPPTSSPSPPPIHPRALTTPPDPPPDPGNIPTSLHYTTLSAILTHSATPWTTLTYENIYFNTILVHDGLDTNLPYPSSITHTSTGEGSSGLVKESGGGGSKGVGGVRLETETGEAALLHSGTASTTLTYVDVFSGSRELSQFEITAPPFTTSLVASIGVAASVSSRSAVSVVSAAATTSGPNDSGDVGSGSKTVAPGSTQVPDLAPCRTATDFEGCVSSAESVALVTSGVGVASSTSGTSSQETVTTGVSGNVVGQGQGQGEVTPTTTVTMPYLGAVVAKGKATFVAGGVESGGVRGMGRVGWGLWLWLWLWLSAGFVVVGGWLVGWFCDV